VRNDSNSVVSQIESRGELGPDCCKDEGGNGTATACHTRAESRNRSSLIQDRARASEPCEIARIRRLLCLRPFELRSLAKCIDAADALGLDDCCLRWVAWRRVRGRCIS
jgi:hypothetical protein